MRKNSAVHDFVEVCPIGGVRCATQYQSAANVVLPVWYADENQFIGLIAINNAAIRDYANMTD
ncbi:hypothetical protein [Paraburkholderia sp. C35]|uniref:hypothetical protein n=1 Tax=Paraburkholderia sp. C35 TaxID=2126993 RepID=UPI0013A5B8FF|nr:hypothetical protein [Paraburkholderia sp. C35]